MAKGRKFIHQLYISVNGVLLARAVMDELFRVEVDTDLHLPGMAALQLHDRTVDLTSTGPFSLGAELKILVGEGDRLQHTPIFIGQITSIEPDFGEGIIVILTVRAYDFSHRLHRGTHIKAYVQMSDSDIASAIAGDVGLKADVDSSGPTYPHVYQDGQTHMEFLRSRARRIGYDCYVLEKTLHFKKASGRKGKTLKLDYGSQLRSFRPVFTLNEQVSEVQVKGWNPSTKREVIGRATSSSAAPKREENTTGAQLAQAFGQASELAVRAAVDTQAEADVVAQALLDEHAGASVEAEGMCYGIPDLRAGCTVELSSLGKRFNGRYQVTSATHIWDIERDYVTVFHVSGRRDGTLRGLLVDEPAGPRPWLAMTGIVTNNNDPDALGRVKVKFPWLTVDIESAWARVVAVGAGSKRGLCVLPEVNDEVLVIFEQGDIDRPLVIGGLWNGLDAPPKPSNQVVVSGKVVQRLFVTRTGHQLVFSDENPATIRLQSVGGQVVLIDDDAKKIEIRTAGGHTVVLDDNGRVVKIESAGSINIQAQQNLSIKANGNISLEASGVTTVKGATVQLNP